MLLVAVPAADRRAGHRWSGRAAGALLPVRLRIVQPEQQHGAAAERRSESPMIAPTGDLPHQRSASVVSLPRSSVCPASLLWSGGRRVRCARGPLPLDRYGSRCFVGPSEVGPPRRDLGRRAASSRAGEADSGGRSVGTRRREPDLEALPGLVPVEVNKTRSGSTLRSPVWCDEVGPAEPAHLTAVEVEHRQHPAGPVPRSCRSPLLAHCVLAEDALDVAAPGHRRSRRALLDRVSRPDEPASRASGSTGTERARAGHPPTTAPPRTCVP